jgi:hypothetical protein
VVARLLHSGRERAGAQEQEQEPKQKPKPKPKLITKKQNSEDGKFWLRFCFVHIEQSVSEISTNRENKKQKIQKNVFLYVLNCRTCRTFDNASVLFIVEIIV